MKLQKFAAASLLCIAAVGITSGTAYADPTPNATLQTDIAPGVHWTANVVDKSVVLKTDAGSLTTQGTQFQVLDNQGHLIAGMPLTYLKDGKEWPIAARVDGNTATLTPSTNPAEAHAATMLKPVDAKPIGGVDFNTALSNAGTEFGLATGVGTLIGTIIGGTLGCVAGAVVGAALMPPIFLPGAAGGCLAGIVAGVALGAAAGMITFGVPVGIAAAIQFYQSVYGQ